MMMLPDPVTTLASLAAVLGLAGITRLLTGDRHLRLTSRADALRAATAGLHDFAVADVGLSDDHKAALLLAETGALAIVITTGARHVVRLLLPGQDRLALREADLLIRFADPGAAPCTLPMAPNQLTLWAHRWQTAPHAATA
jgi:hypothetical protein